MELVFGPVFGFPLLGLPLMSVAWTAFWIWMLIDAILREERDYPGHAANQRLIWVLLIALLHIAAVPYLFMVFAKAKRGAAEVAPPGQSA